jgi:hypothetical protein
MTDEVEVVTPAAEAAPDASGTATPAEAPVSGEQTPATEAQPPKTFKQEDVDEIVSKRLARERRRWEREQQARQQPPIQAAPVDGEPPKPAISEFQTVEEYDRAMTEWTDKRIEAREAKKVRDEQQAKALRESQEIDDTHAEREEKALEKYGDYMQVTRNPRLPITEHMAEAIKLRADGPEIVYHLGKNPQEAARIAQLPAKAQAVEIGVLSAKLAANPPAPKTSSAPEPIVPVNARGSQPVYETTDPRSTKQMNTTDWINAERERQRKKLQAQGYR